MKQNILWRFGLVLFVTLWAVYEMYPPTSRDLITSFEERAVRKDPKDTNIIAIVQTARKLEQAKPGQSFGNLLTAIGTNDITQYFPGIPLQGAKNPTRAILNRIQRDAAGKIRLGLDLQGGTSFLVGVDTKKAVSDTNRVETAETREHLLSQAVEVLRKRVDRFGVAEPIIQPAGENKILIQLPGLSEADKDSAKTQIQKAAFLEFRLVHPESRELLTQGIGAPGYERLFLEETDPNGQKTVAPFLVKRRAEMGLTGKFVSSAFVTRNPVSSQPEIILKFDSKGAELFSQITRENVGNQLAIVLDGELYSAPRINEPIPGGSAQITGDFDLKEAIELANVLQNPLEAPVNIEEERGVDPSLGHDSIKSGIRASIVAAICTFAFMLVFYFFSGMIANFALVLNVVILLGVMCSIESTLTLPGIAGIALTIGMAVDANVLIFERIREELAAGKSIRGVINAGYSKAFGTIFDSNFTTLISSIILYFMGTGPVKGFGITLTIGVCVSMFTALFATRMIFDFLLSRNLISTVKMLPIIKGTKVDFLRLAKPLFIASWLIAFVGIGYGAFIKGKDVLGVDFAGGDALTLRFAQKVEVDKLRSAVEKSGGGDPLIQYQRDIADGKETLQILMAFDSGPKVETALKEQFPDAKFERIGIDKVGPSVGKEIQKSAIKASLLALFGILVYVAFRYELSFAIGAVAAVLHDVMFTLAIFFFAGGVLSSTLIAAILTIIGYSINDKIVILDRIREDLKLGVRGSFKELINQALNETLSRTLITGGSVILATLSLFVFGGGVIHDFAFFFLVGIIAGTYSSIYIASAIVLWWHKGERPKASQQALVDNPAPARA